MACVAGHFLGQRVGLGYVLDDGHHPCLAVLGSHSRGAPACPQGAAIGAAETSLARLQLDRPVDAAVGGGQLVRVQQLDQRHAAQGGWRPVQDRGQRAVGLQHTAVGGELHHAHRGLVEGGAEAAFVLRQMVADAADQQHRQQRQCHQRYRRQQQRGLACGAGTIEQRLRERHLQHAQLVVQHLQPLLEFLDLLSRQRSLPVGGLQFVGHGLQLQDVDLALPPQLHRVAEVRPVACVAEAGDQPRNVAGMVAALEEALAGDFQVGRILLQRQPPDAVAQWRLQGVVRVGQVLGSAVLGVAVERMHGLLLALGPGTLAGNPGNRAGLQFHHQGREAAQARGNNKQQEETPGQPSGGTIGTRAVASDFPARAHCFPLPGSLAWTACRTPLPRAPGDSGSGPGDQPAKAAPGNVWIPSRSWTRKPRLGAGAFRGSTVRSCAGPWA